MHDVFISYKSEDSHLAILVRQALEIRGIPCWMAERDIGPGSNYASDIPNAIRNCKVFILVLTEHAQKSPWIPKELDLAISCKKAILPLVIGEFNFNPTLIFLLTGIQHYDATASLEQTVIQLVPKIREDIASGVSSGDFPRKKRLHLLRRCKALVGNVFSWILVALLILGSLRILEIDVIAPLPEPIQQPVLAFYNAYLLPILDGALELFKRFVRFLMNL